MNKEPATAEKTMGITCLDCNYRYVYRNEKGEFKCPSCGRLLSEDDAKK